MGADRTVGDVAWPSLGDIAEIRFPLALYDAVVDHGRRKLCGRWQSGEEQAPKAYGLVGGSLRERQMTVTHVIPLRNNLRDRPDLKVDIDRLMEAVAVPSETPMDRRSWVADPREVMAAERSCEETGSLLFGAYHMHRVAWAHDRLRDTCTDLDRALARDSGLWALILSLVEPAQPQLRAFFEGDNGAEAAIRIDRGAHQC